MSSGGWYLDNQMYGNKFTSISLHYNTVLREARRVKTDKNLIKGIMENSDYTVTAASDEIQANQPIKKEWRRLGGDTYKFLDPLGNKLGVAVDESIDKQDYDEEGYSIKPLLTSIMQDDFNVNITNEFTDFGDDPLGQMWNMYKQTIPTSRFFQKITTLMADKQDNISAALNDKLQNSFLAKGLMSIVNLSAKNTGMLTSFKKYQNANLMCQGSRFTFYNGTGINFGTLGMRVNIFPKWENGKFITVNKQVEDILPYAVGNIEPVDLETLEELANKLFESLCKEKYDEIYKNGNKKITFQSDLKALVSDFVKFQMPPAAYEPGLRYQDAINKGTLKLRIGPYYSLSDLIIQDLSLNYSKYMVKNPAADSTTTDSNGNEEVRTGVGIHEIADSIYSPLYCEVNLMLRPVSKFTSEKLKEFVSGAWRKSDIKYINNQMRESLKHTEDYNVNRYNTNPDTTFARNEIDNAVSEANKDINQAISEVQDKKAKELEAYNNYLQEWKDLTPKERQTALETLKNSAIKKSVYVKNEDGSVSRVTTGYYTENEWKDLVYETLTGNNNGNADLLSALSSIVDENGNSYSLSSLISDGLPESKANEAMYNFYIEEAVSTNGLTTEHAISNLAYQHAADDAFNRQYESLSCMTETYNNVLKNRIEQGEGYFTDEDGSICNVLPNGNVCINLINEEGNQYKLIMTSAEFATTVQKEVIDSKIPNDVTASILSEDVNTYFKALSDEVNLIEEAKKTTTWENRTIEQITESYNEQAAVIQLNSVMENLASNNDATGALLYLNSVDESVIEAAKNGAVNYKNSYSQALKVDQAEDNSKKKQLLNKALETHVVETSVLINAGLIDKTGTTTESFKNATSLDIWNVIKNAEIDESKYTQSALNQINTAKEKLVSDESIGFESCLNLQKSLNNINYNIDLLNFTEAAVNDFSNDKSTFNDFIEVVKNEYKTANDDKDLDLNTVEGKEYLNNALCDYQRNDTYLEFKEQHNSSSTISTINSIEKLANNKALEDTLDYVYNKYSNTPIINNKESSTGSSGSSSTGSSGSSSTGSSGSSSTGSSGSSSTGSSESSSTGSSESSSTGSSESSSTGSSGSSSTGSSGSSSTGSSE